MKIQDNRSWPLLCILLLIPIPMVWNGFACLKDPCIHGICIDDLVSNYFCYCIDGYTGIHCQTNWNECWSSPCQNGGVCIDGIASFNCSCPAGYTGDLCEENVNECTSNPCINNGTCVDAENTYYCNCLPGYSGIHCEIDEAVCNTTDEVKCFNGGTCQEGPGTSFTCICREGWTGSVCDVETNECMSDPCQNGAVCIDLHADYLCACPFGYTGRNCEDTIHICDNNTCRNGALCLLEQGRPVCYCVPDFHGEQCEFQYDECQLGKRCLNGGSCIDGVDNFTCSCPPRLTGVLCECLILQNNTLDCTYIEYTTTEYPSYSTEDGKNTTISSRTFSELLFLSTTSEVPTTPIETIKTTQIPYQTEKSLEPSNLTFPYTENTFPSTSTSTRTEEETTSMISYSTISEEETVPVYTHLPETLPSPRLIGSTTTKLPLETTTTLEESTVTEFISFTYSPTSSIPITWTPPRPIISNTTVSDLETEYTFSTSYSNFTRLVPTLLTVASSSEESTSSISVPTDLPPTINTAETAEPETIETNITSKFTTHTVSELPTIISILTTFSTLEYETITGESKDIAKETLTTTAIESRTGSGVLDECGTESPCKDGGICPSDKRNCTCDSDTTEFTCDRKLPFIDIAFTGQSYITHRLMNYAQIHIEFEAKTMMKTGLLFHLMVDNAYMTLYIEDNDLKLKFSCGYQTMLLSELNIFVTNGYNMNIKASLNFTKDFSRCIATIKMNNSLSMMGDQKANFDIFFSPPAFLHLGGIPEGVGTEKISHAEGFVGCMSNLKISHRNVKIYEDAEESYGIRDCSSLACLSNPCKNGAMCSSVGDTWKCHCKNGYLGKTCDISICDNNPCLFGGTCLPFTSGYICLCAFGKHGHFCENDIKITEPYFSSTIRGLSSYVAYPFPDIASKSFEIKFRIAPTTIDQISLLLFIGQTGYHGYYSDHLAVTFVKGYIMLTWNLGSGPRRIFTSSPIKTDAKNCLLRLGRHERQAWLFVENIGNITGKSPGNLMQLNVIPLLFIGGHPSRNFSELPHDLPLHSGFSGCIFDMEIKSDNIIIPFQSSVKTFGRAVGQCGINECYDGSCQNGGACLHHGSTFMCLCQDNWYGPLCISKNNICDNDHNNCSGDSRCVPSLSSYQCDCSLGKTGNYCEKSESFSEIGFSGQRSFLALLPIEMETGKFHVEMEVRIFKDEGILFYVEKSNFNFVCLSLMGGVVELRVQTGTPVSKDGKLKATTPEVLRSSRILVKATWHKIKFGVFGRKIYLVVDDKINSGLLRMEPLMRLSKEEIFLGGLPDLSQLPFLASPVLPVPFKGCLRHIAIDKSLVMLTHQNIKESRNLVECDGTPCDGEACLNGGTCWLDSFMKAHCSCVPPFYGDKCENLPKCSNDTCQNRGQCLSNKCSCLLGWRGNFCEKKVKIKVPEFSGKSYMTIKKKLKDKQELKRLSLGNINMNFSTTSADGLMLWSKKNNSFIGIGLEKGHLKLTYSRKNKTFVEVVADGKLSDGLWHNVEVNFNTGQLKIDGILMNTILDVMDSSLSRNEELHIGGLPSQKKILIETGGLYHQAFEGCLESFGSSNLCIRDFSNYEGENIDVCSSF